APQDFRMASLYGVPDDSALADWPFDLDELAPWYARVERELGVAGAGFHAHGIGAHDYSLPPFGINPSGRVLPAAAEKLGWRAAPIPLAINTRPYSGRGACVRCGTCVGFACPSDAKNGTHNTVIPRALATGRCDLLTDACVASIACDSAGEARGVRV